MSGKVRIETKKAPPSHGYRSNAMVAGGFIFTAGHIGAPMRPPGEPSQPAETVSEQVELCLEHMEQLALAGGGSKGRFVEVAALLTPDAFAQQEKVRQQIDDFLGYTPPLVYVQDIKDVAMHAFLEIDGVSVVDPELSLDHAAEILRPFAHGKGVVRSGPFIFLNGMTAPGANLGEQTHNLLNEAHRLLSEAGSGLSNLVKMLVFTREYDTYPQFNEETKRQFAAFEPPARSVVIAPEVTGESRLLIHMVALSGEEA